MNTELATLLEVFAPTYLDVLPADKSYGVTYTLIMGQDDTYESGQPLGERLSYMVRVFQKAYVHANITAICAALRAAGWCLGPRTLIREEADGGYYQYNIEITKWGAIN